MAATSARKSTGAEKKKRNGPILRGMEYRPRRYDGLRIANGAIGTFHTHRPPRPSTKRPKGAQRAQKCMGFGPSDSVFPDYVSAQGSPNVQRLRRVGARPRKLTPPPLAHLYDRETTIQIGGPRAESSVANVCASRRQALLGAKR